MMRYGTSKTASCLILVSIIGLKILCCFSPNLISLSREGPGVSHGLNWVLSGRGIMIKDKAFYNLKASDLHQKGATTAGNYLFFFLVLPRFTTSIVIKWLHNVMQSVCMVFLFM